MMGQESENQTVSVVEQAGGFYAEPQRVQCLNFLLHLAPYSDGSLLVSGDLGSGKSTLLQQFIVKGGDNWRICLLNASELEVLAVFFREIQQGLGFSLQGANDRQAKVEALIGQLAALQKRGLRPIIIIDDAHVLIDEIAEFLRSLLMALQGGDDCLSLVFVADESLASRAWFEAIKSFGLHSFSLTPLDLEESMRYMRHYLEHEGFTAASVTPSKMKKLFKQAQGNIGQINQLLQSEVMPKSKVTNASPVEVNDFKEQLTMTKEAMSPPKKPIKFSKILLGFLTILLVVVIYFEDEMNEYFEPTKTHTDRQDRLMPDDRLAVPPRVGIPEAVDNIMDDMEALGSDEVLIEGEAPGNGEVVDSVDVDAENVKSSQSESVPEVVVDEPVIIEIPNEVVEAAPSQAAEPEVVKVPMVEVQPEPELVVQAQDKNELGEGVIRRESWILEQDPGHYTLQIMSFGQEMGIAKTLEEIPQKEKFSYFKYRKDGKVWYRLAYGIYPDRKSAQAAVAKGLPKALGKIDPWVRRLSDVQKEISSQ